MNGNMHRRLPVLLAAASILTGAVRAQDADPLRGPTVSERSTKTLAHRSMTGDFQRLEGRPEAAAVRLLDLDDATRSRAEAIFEARDMAVAMLLVEEIDAVKEISDAVMAGEGEQARTLLEALWAKFEPDRPRSPLLAPLAEVLDAPQQAELARLVDEYWAAWIDWELRSAGDEAARKAARATTERRLAFQLFQEEVRAGYEATLRRYRDAMEAIYAAVEPTEEQRQQMRAVLIDHIRETRLKATPAQRRAATRRIYDLLDEERRGKLFDYLLRQVVPDT